MTLIYKFLIACLITVIFSQNDYCSIYKSEINKIKVYLVQSVHFKTWFTIEGDSQNIDVHFYLLTTDNKTSIDAGGLWAGVGFGGIVMNGTDIIVCKYVQTKFGCMDAKSRGHIVNFTSNNGENNVILLSSNIYENLGLDYGDYKTLIHWNFKKDISNPDYTHWVDWKNWKTNNGTVIGSVGYWNLKFNYMNKHERNTAGIPIYIKDLSNIPYTTCTAAFINNYLICLVLHIIFLVFE